MLLNIITASLMGVSILAAPLDAGPAESGNISGAVKAIEQGPLEPGVTAWGTPSLFERTNESSGLVERQRFCGYDDSLVGDGSPRKRRLNKQLSVSYSWRECERYWLINYCSKLSGAAKHLDVASARWRQSLTPLALTLVEDYLGSVVGLECRRALLQAIRTPVLVDLEEPSAFGRKLNIPSKCKMAR